MNIKGNLKFIFIGSTLFLIMYLFVGAIPLGSDINFEPVWTVQLPQAETAGVIADGMGNLAAGSSGAAAGASAAGNSGAAGGASVAGSSGAAGGASAAETFVLGNAFGYFSADGTILKATHTEDRITASSFGWSINPQESINPIVYSPENEKILSIAGSGNIHLDEDRIYLFRPGGDGVSQYSKEGMLLWSRDHIAPITAFNSSKSGTIIGYADGKLSCISSDGTTLFSIYPGGSNYQIILGVALSEDGRQAICVSGIDQQRILVISINGNQHKIVFHEYLEGNARKNCLAHFESEGLFAFVEISEALGIIECKKNILHTIPIEGEIISIGEDPNESLFMVLSKNDSVYSLTAIERPNRIVGKTSFAAQDAFLIQRGNALFLGTDSQISRINIRGTK